MAAATKTKILFVKTGNSASTMKGLVTMPFAWRSKDSADVYWRFSDKTAFLCKDRDKLEFLPVFSDRNQSFSSTFKRKYLAFNLLVSFV